MRKRGQFLMRVDTDKAKSHAIINETAQYKSKKGLQVGEFAPVCWALCSKTR